MAAGDSRIGQTFGKYRIVSRLGKGGMGEVYEAYDDSKGRTVALKILAPQYSEDEEFRTRFRRESRAAAILQEPHVIPIHDWGEIDGNLYIDMRLVKGETLHDVLQRGPITASRTVAIISGVAGALDAAHAAGLIHRDIKPQNIILTADDFPYLVDFGIAEAKGDTGLTMTGTYLGTVAYMAPERFGARESTPGVDVYSLTCVLYQCLTGRTPFASGTLEQAMLAHLQSAPPRASATHPGVPTSFDEVIAHGMAKDPDRRIRTAGELGAAARRALTPQAGPTVASNTVRSPAPPSPASPPSPALYNPYADPFGGPSASDPYGGRTGPPSDPYGGRTGPPSDPYGGRTGPPSDPFGGGLPPDPFGGPSGPPTSFPPMWPQSAGSSKPKRPKWLMPTAIAFVAVLLIGLVGVLIAQLTASQDTNSATTSPAGNSGDTTSQTTTSTRTGSNDVPTSSKAATTPPPPPSPPPPTGQSLPPPLVTGPDLTSDRATCDGGYTLTSRTGFGTSGGRGTPETSCQFMYSVLTAYWAQYGNAARSVRSVSAPGAVPCTSVLTDGRGCDGDNFLMQCQAFPGQNYITCEGGRNAVVYLF